MVEASVERQCPRCHEMLKLNQKESRDGYRFNCPICNKGIRVALKGFMNKHIELKKDGMF